MSLISLILTPSRPGRRSHHHRTAGEEKAQQVSGMGPRSPRELVAELGSGRSSSRSSVSIRPRRPQLPLPF